MAYLEPNRNSLQKPKGNRLLSKQKLIGLKYYLIAQFRVLTLKEYVKFATAKKQGWA